MSVMCLSVNVRLLHKGNPGPLWAVAPRNKKRYILFKFQKYMGLFNNACTYMYTVS